MKTRLLKALALALTVAVMLPAVATAADTQVEQASLQNVLMTGADPLSVEKTGSIFWLTVFGSKIPRSAVGSVTFKDSLAGAPKKDAWDVSARGNGAVLAWVVENGNLYDLTIAAEGGVRLNADSSHLFQGYTSATRIDFGGCVDTSRVTDMNSMFDSCYSLTAQDLSGFDTSNVTDMRSMFDGCYKLTTLDVSGFDTSNVTDMRSMFDGCSALTELDVSGFMTGNVTDMSWMFRGCSALTELDVSGFDTSNVTSMRTMFGSCYGLTTLDVSGFDTSDVTDMYAMFANCRELTALDLSWFDTSNVTNMSYMFNQCYSLTALDLSGFDLTAVTESKNAFKDCPAIITVNGETMTPKQWLKSVRVMRNVLMTGADPLLEEHPGAIWGLTVFGSEILRRDVGSVTFRDSVSGAPEDAWDVSAGKDGSVLAWVVKNGGLYDLTIAGEGGVCLNEDSSHLFQCYTSAVRIDFGGCVDTFGVTDMDWMFVGCDSLTELDVSCFDTSNVTNMSEMFRLCSKLTALDVSEFDTSSVTNMSEMFSSCSALTELDVSGFDTSSVTDMSWMFSSCSALTELDVSGFDTSSVTDMSHMFNGCSALTELNVSGFDTSSMPNMEDMFKNCPAVITVDAETMTSKQGLKSTGGMRNVLMTGADPLLEEDVYAIEGLTVFGSAILRSDVGSVTFRSKVIGAPGDAWDVSAGKDGSVLAWAVKNGDLYDLTIAAEGGVCLNEDSSHLFQGYTSAVRIDFGYGVDTSVVTNMNSMFNYCYNLTTLGMGGFNTSNVTDMRDMFLSCGSLTSLDVSGFDTGNVTDMSGTFSRCYKLTKLDVSRFDTGNVTDMSGMFSNCYALTKLDMSGFDTSNVTNMRAMFFDCHTLTALDVSGFDTSNVTDMEDMFENCPASITANGETMTSEQWLKIARVMRNVLMTGADPLLEEDADTIEGLTVFGSAILRKDVGSVTFRDSVSGAPENAWDVSAGKDGAVLAWAVKNGGLYDLTVAAEGGVRLNEDSSRLFQGYTSAVRIDFGGCVDTSVVTNMNLMFDYCYSLTALDLSSFDTSNVTDMSGMFSNCYVLSALDVSGFKTSNVTDMRRMFSNCSALTALDLSGFDLSAVAESKDAFKDCPAIITVNGETMTPKQWLKSVRVMRNVLMTGADPLLAENLNATWDLTVFGSAIQRRDVGSVTFMDSVSGAPEDAWDVSAGKDGSVLAWAVKNGGLYDLTIAAEGGVRLNEDSSHLFQSYTSAVRIDFGGCVDTFGVTDMEQMFFCCVSLTTLDVSKFETGDVTDMSGMFSNCYKLKKLDVSGFDTGNVTDMSGMFSNCNALTKLDVSGFDTSNVTDMNSMFDTCNLLTALDVSGFDTSNVTNMSEMFRICSALTALDVSGFDTSNVTNMADMFCRCSALAALDVSGFDTSNVTNMHAMFSYCQELTALDVSGFDTSNVTDMSAMFSYCQELTALDLGGFGTSNVTDMSGMFDGCSALTTLDVSGFDTGNVTDMLWMFRNCSALTALDLSGFDMSNVTDMSCMFVYCSALTALDLSGFDTSSVTNISSIFEDCPASITVNGETMTSEQWLQSVGL